MNQALLSAHPGVLTLIVHTQRAIEQHQELEILQARQGFPGIHPAPAGLVLAKPVMDGRRPDTCTVLNQGDTHQATSSRRCSTRCNARPRRRSISSTLPWLTVRAGDRRRQSRRATPSNKPSSRAAHCTARADRPISGKPSNRPWPRSEPWPCSRDNRARPSRRCSVTSRTWLKKPPSSTALSTATPAAVSSASPG